MNAPHNEAAERKMKDDHGTSTGLPDAAAIANNRMDDPSALPAMAQDVITSMAGASVCQGWDIVCSYELDTLNQCLVQHLSSQTPNVTVPFTANDIDPLTGAPFTVDGSVTLAHPDLSFKADLDGSCQVEMTITGGSYKITSNNTPGEPKPIPANIYTLVVVLFIKAIRGDGTDAQGGDGVVVFDPSHSDAAHLVLHFNTSDASEITWSISPQPAPADDSLLTRWVLPAVIQHFKTQVKDIDYALTGVNNTAAPAQGGIQVQPSSFVFATWGSGPKGVLSIFIQTTSTGSTPPTSRPFVQKPLISQDHSASLVFSPNFIQKAYLEPQLTALRYVVAPVPQGPGPSVTAASQAQITFPKSGFNFAHQLGTDHVLEFDAVTTNLSSFPYTLSFQTAGMTASISFQIQQDWEIFIITRSGSALDSKGTATASVSLNKTLNFSDIVTVSDETFQFAFTIAASDYTVSVDPGISDSCWSGDMASDVSKAVRKTLGSSSVTPPISINLASLNFVRASNLLFPGQSLVKVDFTTGLHAPCDLVLFGSLQS